MFSGVKAEDGTSTFPACCRAVYCGRGSGNYWRPRSRAETIAQPILLELLGDVDSVRAIGLAYRHSFAHEQTSDALERAILRRVGPAARLSDRLLRARLEARVQHDFETGDTVQIGGWILARTEARQCALFTILYS